MIISLVLVNIIFIFFILIFILNTNEVTKVTILSLILFFSMYTLISGIYFWIDLFNILNVLVTLLIVLIISILFLFLHSKDINKVIYKIRSLTFNKNNNIIFLIILISIPFTWQKFEFFGMGQDQGVYQTKAIELIYGNNKNKVDIIEYDLINYEQGREQFYEIFKNNTTGFDLIAPTISTINNDEIIEPISANYHGIPTFASLLALSGSIFGISGMMYIQTVFFILCIFLMFYIGDNLKLNTITKLCITIIFAFSPVVLWVSKSALTEMYLSVIMLSFIFFITSEHKFLKFLSFSSVATFSFFHVSAFTMMPIFILIYVFKILEENNKNILCSSILALMFFLIGFIMMLSVAPMYSYNNIMKTPVGEIISSDNLLIFVQFIVLFVFISLIYFYRFKININKYLNIQKYIIIISVLTFLTIIALIFYRIGFIYETTPNNYYYGEGFLAFKHLTIFAYSYATGFVILPLTIILIIIKPEKVLKNVNNIILFLLFLYCILLYSALMAQEVLYYYYFSRYIVPFISIILLFAGILLNKNRNILILITIISLIYIMPYTKALLNGKDHTKLTWNIFESLELEISSNDIVIIDDYFLQTLYLPLRAITGAKIYPLIENIENVIDEISDSNANIFYITDDVNNNNFELYFNNLYSGDYILSKKYLTSQNNAFFTDYLFPYPDYFVEQQNQINVIKLEYANLIYNFDPNTNFYNTGFYELEHNNFKWTKDGNSKIAMYLNKMDYRLNIELHDIIPFNKLKKNYVEAEIFINNILLDTKIISEHVNTNNIEIYVPEDVINDGFNILNIRSNTWSPTELGLSDSRKLGLAINKVTLEPITLEY